jgi:predicted hydrocarbon binding protein
MLTDAYGDDEFNTCVERTAQETGETRDRVLRRFGMFAAVSTFRLLYPDYYAAHADALSFLLSVEERIHETVRRTVSGAAPPRLDVTRIDQDTLMISYTSDRQLCALLDGLVTGVGRYYGESLSTDQTSCMLKGDAAGCSFVVTRTPRLLA